MARPQAFTEGSDYGFSWPRRHRDLPEVDCPYAQGSEERDEWMEGYIHGKRCEMLT